MRTDILIRRLVLIALLWCFGVIVLGAYVRLSAAGLGCPDWPGCYGHLYPEKAADLGKAWREMLHRYAASTLGLFIVLIAAFAIAKRRERLIGVGYVLALLATVVVQGMLGALTVTWRLKPLIVSLHLIFGLATLSLLWWLYLSLRARPLGGTAQASDVVIRQESLSARHARIPRRLAGIAVALLAVQIALGGWTSSHYAAVACPDFPKCQNQWWPHTDYKDAFVLWRGLGINYEGGVLDHPARIAIHLTHRIGALLASLALLLAALAVLRRPILHLARPAAIAVLLALALQLTIGISMVLKAFPLPLATAHNAGAALLLLAAIALYRQTARFCQ